MTLRAALPADVPALDAFLLAHADGAMFPLANLRDHGPGPGDHRHATRFWIAETAGAVTGAVGLTGEGMLLPQWPDGDWPTLRPHLAGAAPIGAVGPAPQVRAAISALGLAGAPTRTDADEPGFALDLTDLVVPDGPGRLQPLRSGDAGIVTPWRAAYLSELFAMPAAEAARQAPREVADWIDAGTHHLLWVEGRPVALCGLNAVLPEIVQVGGVYTPRALRGRGHARRAMALMLQAARGRGVRRAVLFAASPAAARAYATIGFSQIDPVGLILFDGAQEVTPWP